MAATEAEIVQALTSEQIAIIGLYINVAAIFVSALFAVYAVFSNRSISRKRATLDIVILDQSDPRHAGQRTSFVKLRDAGHLAQYAAPDKTASDEAQTIRAIMNRYELVAISIRKGTMDEDAYKQWYRTTLVKDWIACKPMVVQLRQNEGTNAYFCEFEKLAKRWAKGPEIDNV